MRSSAAGKACGTCAQRKANQGGWGAGAPAGGSYAGQMEAHEPARKHCTAVVRMQDHKSS